MNGLIDVFDENVANKLIFMHTYCLQINICKTFFAKIYSSMWDICYKTTIAALKCNVHTYNGFWNYVFPVHDDITNLKHAYVTRLYNVHILHLLILDQSSSDTDLLETTLWEKVY